MPGRSGRTWALSFSSQLVRLLDASAKAGVDVWVDGGWVQMLVHSGYKLSEKDHQEIRALQERFGVELPPGYRAEEL